MPDDDNKPDPQSTLRALRPMHCVNIPAALHIRRRTGRPRQARLRPDVDGQAYAEEVAEIAERFIAQDSLVQATAVEHDRDDTTVLDVALLQLAREAAALAYETQKLMREGKDCGQVAGRRVEALSKIASLVSLRARLGGDLFDPRHPQVQRIVGHFLSGLSECATETLGPEKAEMFMAAYHLKIAGWEERV